MGILNSNKVINATRIDCDGVFKVTLALTAAPNIANNPTDIVLILDRSGSMAGSPFANLKNGAKKFIDIIDEATDADQDGNIGSGSRIGIVSFDGTATQDTQLITSVDDLKTSIDALGTGGNTNHADAFEKATALFDPASQNAKVMVMFTDGKTTAGPDPSPVAAAARAQGIIIYCIGLVGDTGIDPLILNDWATDPDASHVAVTPDDAELEDLFEDLAANIVKPGATNIVIEEEVNPDFRIESVSAPTKGMAIATGDTTLRWTMDALGVHGNEGASLEFYVKHVGQISGSKEVNKTIDYDDTENNSVTFPHPSVEVDCGIVVTPEDCPDPVDITIEGCEDFLEYDAGNVYLQSLGRVLVLDLTLKRICPHRRVALAVFLTEIDDYCVEHKRGLKTFTIPAHTAPACRDIEVKCLKFVLPEDLDVSGSSQAICNKRKFKVRLIAHYIDTDFVCCEQTITCI